MLISVYSFTSQFYNQQYFSIQKTIEISSPSARNSVAKIDLFLENNKNHIKLDYFPKSINSRRPLMQHKPFTHSNYSKLGQLEQTLHSFHVEQKRHGIFSQYLNSRGGATVENFSRGIAAISFNNIYLKPPKFEFRWNR